MKTLVELHPYDKPREKLRAKGTEALKNEELVAVILGSGIKGKDIRQLSKEIARRIADDPDAITLETLMHIRGLGQAKASQIVAALALGKRLFAHTPTPRIRCGDDAYALLRDYAYKRQEHFLSLTLDGASGLIRIRTVHIGTLNQSLVHPREVFADAIADRAAGVIVAHNHPSGTLVPSRTDIRITERLKQTADIVGIELLDHLILTPEGYYSFAEEGML